MEIIEETGANWLVSFEDGRIDTVGKSPLNELLIKHNLWGLLKRGDEMLVINETDDHPRVALTPDDGAVTYILRVGDYEGLHLGAHHKSKIVDALIEAEDRDERARALIRLYDTIRENSVREAVVASLVRQPPFKGQVKHTTDGWYIKNHLLLTWEGEFFHPKVETMNRTGSTVVQGSSQPAYKLSIASTDAVDRDITVHGRKYRLTDAEVEFIAKAVWAVQNAPEVA